ncbi:RNA-binding S4 domain-containing protein [Diaphorobacter sp. HDW4A]|uniref:RNA-binding S4 domain-containing protein n=1 Tax=Diaphorobacter sp. HDW4A TaxID=2714924 RepID=UPI0014089531|nr:RNA-binding S4 domain-containing protein [Diaphorobacter sp. HDW4A]QIL79526.1 RNA-binding S4 domain-containing protein [Diaphorobacter sp. HDW4A]
MNDPIESMRLDKWLWCARFYKTRSVAVEEIGKGRVMVNNQNAKAARELRVGDTVSLRQGVIERIVVVQALSNMRGPAPVAQQLYKETEASSKARAEAAERRRLAPEPASSLVEGRPTKRDRRQIDHVRHEWDDRWSASIDDE